MRRALIIAAASVALLGATKAPKHEASGVKRPYSAVYCQAGRHKEFRMFVAKELPDGRLMFHISHWLPNGALTGDHGVAEREGDHWIFERAPDEDDRSNRCRLRIWLRAGGAPEVVPDKATPCRGGYDSPMGRVAFAKQSYYKPVTRELDPGTSPDEDDACRGSPAEKR